MKKIDIAKLNRSNKDIWVLIEQAVKTKNFALIEKNLQRLHSLQEYYSKLLNFQDIEIRGLQGDLDAQTYLTSIFEKEWLEQVAKRSHSYDILKERIDKMYP